MRKLEPFVKTLESNKRRFKRLLGTSQKKNGLCSGLVTLRKDEEVGIHSTGEKEEILVILEGKAQVEIKDKSFILKEKMMLYIPPDMLHNVKNIGTSSLKYLYITAPISKETIKRR